MGVLFDDFPLRVDAGKGTFCRLGLLVDLHHGAEDLGESLGVGHQGALNGHIGDFDRTGLTGGVQTGEDVLADGQCNVGVDGGRTERDAIYLMSLYHGVEILSTEVRFHDELSFRGTERVFHDFVNGRTLQDGGGDG